MKLRIISVFFLLISSLMFVGCTSDYTYVPPTSEVVDNLESESPGPEQFSLGDSATDSQLKITLNSVRFSKIIDELDNEYSIAESSKGKTFVILDITVENILQDKVQSVSTLMNALLVDSEGYNYETSVEGLFSLDKGFKDGEILPGMKKRGEISFLVPDSSRDLKFIFRFDLFDGTSAVFNI